MHMSLFLKLAFLFFIGRLRERFRDSKDFKIVTMRGVGYKVVKL